MADHTAVLNDTSQGIFVKEELLKLLKSDKLISVVNSLFANNLEK